MSDTRYDAAGRWPVVGGTAGTFTYGYPAGSAGFQPASLTLPGGGYVTNSYDALARLIRTELRTSAGAILNAHGYAYNPAGQLTNAWTYLPDGTPVTAQHWSYGYDAAQNLTKRTNYTTVETFTVNALNQLVTVPDGAVQYDWRGNLVKHTLAAARPTGPGPGITRTG